MRSYLYVRYDGEATHLYDNYEDERWNVSVVRSGRYSRNTLGCGREIVQAAGGVYRCIVTTL